MYLRKCNGQVSLIFLLIQSSIKCCCLNFMTTSYLDTMKTIMGINVVPWKSMSAQDPQALSTARLRDKVRQAETANLAEIDVLHCPYIFLFFSFPCISYLLPHYHFSLAIHTYFMVYNLLSLSKFLFSFPACFLYLPFAISTLHQYQPDTMVVPQTTIILQQENITVQFLVYCCIQYNISNTQKASGDDVIEKNILHISLEQNNLVFCVFPALL